MGLKSNRRKVLNIRPGRETTSVVTWVVSGVESAGGYLSRKRALSPGRRELFHCDSLDTQLITFDKRSATTLADRCRKNRIRDRADVRAIGAHDINRPVRAKIVRRTCHPDPALWIRGHPAQHRNHFQPGRVLQQLLERLATRAAT